MKDELTVTLGIEDVADLYRPASTRGRKTVVLLLVTAIAILVVILLNHRALGLHAQNASLVNLLGGIAITLVALILLLLGAGRLARPVAARKFLDHHPGAKDPIHYIFEPGFLDVRSTFTHSRYPWSELWSWRETERVIIVNPGPNSVLVIPKAEAGAELLQRLRGYLAAARRPSAGKR